MKTDCSQINILHIRALVKADAVFLFDTYGSVDSKLHSLFLYQLEVGNSPTIPGLTFNYSLHSTT